MLLCVFKSASECGPPLFIFKGNSVPYRVVLKGEVTEMPISLFPSFTVIATRDDIRGVGLKNFRNWAHCFVDYIKDYPRMFSKRY